MEALLYANYGIYIMSEAFDDLTNLRLNLLLFYAQGYFLKRYGKPLFPDRIEAWEDGPVIPNVYSRYRMYEDTPIKEYDLKSVSLVSKEAKEILFCTVRTYGRYTTKALQNMARILGSPWDLTFRPGQDHKEIPVSLIREYFSDLEDLKPVEKKFKESDFIGYRDKDGILVLPKGWDD